MKKANILIVDDEPDICWALEFALKQEGYHINCVGRGEEAIKMVKEELFQLALVDAKLPAVNGIDLSRQLKGLAPSMSIIMISGYLYEDDYPIQEGLRGGDYAGFISKPFKLDDVSRLVKKVLEAHPY